MQKMHDAGVDMIGYVYTSYGQRSISAVEADIQTYATKYPLLKGIFLDEGATDSSTLPFYKQAYDYIMAVDGWEYTVINPGTIPDEGFLDVSTQLVTFENYGSVAGSVSAPGYATCDNKEQFVAIAHTTSLGSLESILQNLVDQQYFGYMYVTDGAGGCCTYNQLSTYYAAEAPVIADLSL